MKTLLLAASCLFITGLNAQTLPYSFSVLNEPYQPLTDTISVNAGEIWDDPEYFMPIGFTIQVIDEAWTQMLITAPGSLVIGDFSADSIHVLIPVLEDICDVGLSTGTSSSPISYKVDGTPGEQIFKLEWSNVGFYDEYAASNTNFNTFSFQLWLYEGTNVIEYRFGPSAVKGSNLFQFGGPMSAICEDFVNGQNNEWQNLWYTSGVPASPTIELMDISNFKSIVPLNDLPPSGTVFHFGPLFVNQEEITAKGMKVFPTAADDEIWIQTPAHSDATAQLFDLGGKAIAQYRIQDGLQRIDVSQLPQGIYFIHIQGLGVQKFIKQ
jgi:hypothetical protein